jgi:mannosyltransferase OCH1-like enzyme
MPIPKVIYQTWKSKDIPPNIRKVQERMLAKNPGYEIRFFDDDDIDRFMQQYFPESVFRAYKKIYVGAGKADFWRYCVLYVYGGIYLDIDSEITGSLDELIQPHDQAIVTRENNLGKFNQWFLIFEQGHPILHDAIIQCCYNIDNRVTMNLLELTGPVLYTNSINRTMVPYLNEKLSSNKGEENYDKPIHLYFGNDDDLNRILNNPEKNVRCRFYKIDMDTYGRFKHEYAEDLYQNGNISWGREPKIFNDS